MVVPSSNFKYKKLIDSEQYCEGKMKTTSSKESSMINRKNSTSKKENAKGNSSKGSTLIELIEDRHVDVM